MLIVSLCLVLLLCLSAAYTQWCARQISEEMKPDGSFAAVDGVRLHYHYYPASLTEPEAPVLVFLHGASGNAYDARLAFLKALKGRYPLLFIDRPGLGFSQRNAFSHNSPKGQAKVIAALLEKLGIRRTVVVGHSLGAATAAALGLVAPDKVKGLAFLAPVSHPWPGGVPWYYTVAALPLIGNMFCRTLTLPIAERLASRAISSVFHPDLPPEHYASQTRVPLVFVPNVFRANACNITVLKQAVTDQSKHYASLLQPALIVTGTQDTVVWPSIHCEGLLTDLPNAQLLMLDGAGHMPHHTHTAQIAAALDQLICRAGRDGGEPEISEQKRQPFEPA